MTWALNEPYSKHQLALEIYICKMTDQQAFIEGIGKEINFPADVGLICFGKNFETQLAVSNRGG